MRLTRTEIITELSFFGCKKGKFLQLILFFRFYFSVFFGFGVFQFKGIGNRFPAALFLSRFCPDFLIHPIQWLSVRLLRRYCPLSGICPNFWIKGCPMSLFPDSACLDSDHCLDFVPEKAVRCRSFRLNKGETELSRFPVSLSADVWLVCLFQHIAIALSHSRWWS